MLLLFNFKCTVRYLTSSFYQINRELIQKTELLNNKLFTSTLKQLKLNIYSINK